MAMTKEIALIAMQVRIGPETNKRLAGYAVGKHTFPLYSGAYGVISMYSITQEGTTAINGVDSPSTVATFVTYIGVCLSVFFLVVSITVNKKIGLTRSVPGKNHENLSIALILSHILFVTGIGANDYQVVQGHMV
jgi:hypothetical protein